MNGPVCRIKEKFAVIDKQGGPQLHPQIIRPFFNNGCIASARNNEFETVKGGLRLTIKGQWCNPMALVNSLTGNAVG